jgi:hypothetical protein
VEIRNRARTALFHIRSYDEVNIAIEVNKVCSGPHLLPFVFPEFPSCELCG